MMDLIVNLSFELNNKQQAMGLLGLHMHLHFLIIFQCKAVHLFLIHKSYAYLSLNIVDTGTLGSQHIVCFLGVI